MNILTWFETEQKKSTLQKKIISLKDSKEWHMTPAGTLSKKDGKYYEIVLVAYQKPGEPWYENAMIRSTSQHQHAQRQIHGMVLVAEHNGKFLVQAKAEAGNITPGHIVLTTTIQSSHDNIAKYPIPYKQLMNEKPVFQFAAPQDAGMLYEKNNEYRLVRITQPLEAQDHFYWATIEEIHELQKHNLVGDHLTQMMGHILLSGVLQKKVAPDSKQKKTGVEK